MLRSGVAVRREKGLTYRKPKVNLRITNEQTFLFQLYVQSRALQVQTNIRTPRRRRVVGDNDNGAANCGIKCAGINWGFQSYANRTGCRKLGTLCR